MKLLVFSEESAVFEMVQNVLENTEHDMERFGLGELSSSKDLTGHDVIVVDKKSWQRCVTIFKYFGILDAINDKPLVILTNELKANHLKFRDSKQKTAFSPYPIKAEDFFSSLTKLMTVSQES
ncbi:MAG: hypothetical protein HQK83_11990 [Fibrobacteria bacterium]|nr:hypothetical protein [Fibrobacteria bacterium]